MFTYVCVCVAPPRPGLNINTFVHDILTVLFLQNVFFTALIICTNLAGSQRGDAGEESGEGSVVYYVES